MSKRYFVLLGLALAAVVGVFALTGVTILAILDVPSLAVVIMFPVLMDFASHGPRDIARCFRVAFTSNAATRTELESALVYFDGLSRYLASGGVLGVTIGMVAVLGFAPVRRDLESVGLGLALCLLAAVYAVVLIAMVAVPFRTAVRKRLASLAS
jgi:hypothetical protein